MSSLVPGSCGGSNWLVYSSFWCFDSAIQRGFTKKNKQQINNIILEDLSTLWLFNIAMENGPFIDGLPIKNGDFPWLC